MIPMASLFDDIGPDLARVPGLHSGQQELLILLTRLAADRGQWTGSRAELAAELGCSPDTVTRRKDKLVAMGLISAAPSGRVMTYRVLSSRGSDGFLRGDTARALKGGKGQQRADKAPKRRWWQRPDDNQLELDFGSATLPTNRREVARRLAATTMEWMSLVITLVVGPATSAAKRPTTPATSNEKQPEPTKFVPSAVAKPPTPAIEPAAPTHEPATPPTTFEPPIGIGTSIPPLPETTLLSPTDPIEVISTDTSRALKFCLWPNAKKEDFINPSKVQEVFERLKRSGGCTDDERLQVFKFVANVLELAKPTDRVPGLITAILRGSGTPWRSRGNAINEQTARAMIRTLDVPAELQRRTSDLSVDVERARQVAALRDKYSL
jgi:hypothetical protein